LRNQLAALHQAKDIPRRKAYHAQISIEWVKRVASSAYTDIGRTVCDLKRELSLKFFFYA
jgi:hypothetical protein